MSASTPTAAEPGLGRLGPAYLSPIESGRESWPSTSISAVTAFFGRPTNSTSSRSPGSSARRMKRLVFDSQRSRRNEEKRVFVNPATVTYLQELGEDEGFRRLRLGTSIGALHCPAARSGARRERGLPRPTPTRHSTRGAELLAADAPRGSRRDYCWSPRIQRSAVVSAPLPDSLERALHAHADEGSGGRAARAWPTGAAGPQPRARALPACVAECGNCDMLPSTIAPRCVAILSRSTGRLDPSSSLPARAASRRQALGRGAGY